MQYQERKSYKGGTDIVIVKDVALHEQAQLTWDLMKQLAIVAAVPDGEDSHGRQKLRLMTSEEVVLRATNIADLAWKNFRERGWLLDLPMPKLSEDTKP